MIDFSPISKQEWTLEAAAHLLNRAAFGGSPVDVLNLHSMGPVKAVDVILQNEPNDSFFKFDVQEQMMLPFLREHTVDESKKGLHVNQLEEFLNNKRTPASILSQFFNDQGKDLNLKFIKALRKKWLDYLCSTPFCGKDKLALFWHSHLPVTPHRKNPKCISIKRYVDVIRSKGLDSFSALLKAVCKEHAMATYLDLLTNRKGKINENFARELLELFTVGEGNYTQQDVTEIARVFTGYEYDDELNLTINLKEKDEWNKSIFDKRYKNIEPDELLDLLVSNKNCSANIAVKLWKYYVSEDIDKPTSSFISSAYSSCNLNTSVFLKRLFLSKEFYSSRYIKQHIKNPVELLLQAAKSFELETIPADFDLDAFLHKTGYDLFFPPTVKGWPGGKQWITSCTLFARYKAVGSFVSVLSKADVDILLPTDEKIEIICDRLSARLFQSPPSEKLKKNMIAFITQTNYSSIYTKKELLRLIMCTPLYQAT